VLVHVVDSSGRSDREGVDQSGGKDDEGNINSCHHMTVFYCYKRPLRQFTLCVHLDIVRVTNMSGPISLEYNPSAHYSEAYTINPGP